MMGVLRFCEMLEERLAAGPTIKVVVVAEDGCRSFTNAVFLLGAYLVIMKGMSAKLVSETFRWLEVEYQGQRTENFRDATFSEPDFGLTLLDTWCGLERGRRMGWVDKLNSEGLWGKTDILEYAHCEGPHLCQPVSVKLLSSSPPLGGGTHVLTGVHTRADEDPLNADLHIVVPGKFVAFKGPKLLESEYADDEKVVAPPHIPHDARRHLSTDVQSIHTRARLYSAHS